MRSPSSGRTRQARSATTRTASSVGAYGGKRNSTRAVSVAPRVSTRDSCAGRPIASARTCQRPGVGARTAKRPSTPESTGVARVESCTSVITTPLRPVRPSASSTRPVTRWARAETGMHAPQAIATSASARAPELRMRARACWPCRPRRAVGARCGRRMTTNLLVVTGRARWFAGDRGWIDRRGRPRPRPFGVRSRPWWGSAGQPGVLLHGAHEAPACCLTTRLAVAGAPDLRCPSTRLPHGGSPARGRVLPRRGQHGNTELLRAKRAAEDSNQADRLLSLRPRPGGPAIASTLVANAGSRSWPFAAVRPPARTTGRLPRQAGTGPSTAATRAT